MVGSWLLDLTAMALIEDPELSKFTGNVQDSGEGRWTIMAAIEEAVPCDVLSASALHPVPFASGPHVRREDALRHAEQVRRPRGTGLRRVDKIKAQANAYSTRTGLGVSACCFFRTQSGEQLNLARGFVHRRNSRESRSRALAAVCGQAEGRRTLFPSRRQLRMMSPTRLSGLFRFA